MQKPEHEVSEEAVRGLCLTNGLVTSCRDRGSGWSQVETERSVCESVCASVLEQDLIESEGLVLAIITTWVSFKMMPWRTKSETKLNASGASLI